MATTKIWPVKYSLKGLLDYATNPDKTNPDSDLWRELHYVTDERKTVLPSSDGSHEKLCFVTGINCVGEKAFEMMTETQERFGKTGGNVAYHAYQSFKPGEVTPELCHKLGVDLARKMWGERYQVVVTSHGDHAHLHNHFCVCSVSFVDGKKYSCNEREYFKMRKLSDELCRANGLSVIKNPKGRTPRNLYFAEKNDEPTRYNLMREAICGALAISANYRDFARHLRDQGYEFDRNEGGKYAKIKRLRDSRWTRIYHLGEDYTLENIDDRLDSNRFSYRIVPYERYYTRIKQKNGIYKKSSAEQKHLDAISRMPLFQALVCHFLYLIGGCSEYDPLHWESNRTPYEPITPEMREERRRMDSLMRQSWAIGDHNLNTKEDVDRYLEENQRHMMELIDTRKQLYNLIRSTKDPDKLIRYKQQRDVLTAGIGKCRQVKEDMSNLLERSGVMLDMIRNEEKARDERIAREYYKDENEMKLQTKKRKDYER